MRFDWLTSVFSLHYKTRKWLIGFFMNQIMRLYSFMKEIKVYIYILCISSFSLSRQKKICFLKEIKHVLHAIIARWKPWQILWEFLSSFKISSDVWSALKFPQTFASVFTRLWRPEEHAMFFKWSAFDFY